MATEISVGEVDQAEAALLEAKRKAQRKSATNADQRAYQEAAQELSNVRRAWREQEESAGRRTGLAGGDATPEG